MLGMLKPIHPERPAINSPHICWDEIASKIANKKLRFDGSREDYWTYLHALEETFVRAGTGLATKIGLDSYVRVPPVYAQYMNVRYWRRQHQDMPFYILDHAVRDALLNTDVGWIDAEAFLNLPDALGIVLNPVHEALSLFRTGGINDYHPISDFLLFRVTDPEHRTRLAQHHGKDPEDPGLQIFYWMAMSRENWAEGAGGMNFGSFPITSNVKLSDFSKSLDGVCRASAARQLAFGEPTIKNQDPELEDLINESNRVHRDAMQDLIRVDEQAASLAVCEEFLIKFVLLYNCEWFQGRAVPLPPPGVKAMPHKSAQLWMDWGKRYKVILPPPEQVQDAPEDENDQDHERRHPVRHWVRGFFRSQPYGPGRTLRKVLWIAPFWRGKVRLG